MSVEWKVIPRLEIISNDGQWNHFKCFQAGEAIWTDDNLNTHIIDFPIDWRTDVATVPMPLRVVLSQIGAHSPAAILHDRALDMGWERRQARALMIDELATLRRLNTIQKTAMIAGVFIWDQILKIKPDAHL